MKKFLWSALISSVLLAPPAFAQEAPPQEALASPEVEPPVGAPALPSSYDLRDHNRVPPVRDQGSYDTSWAHAALGAIESNAITNGLYGPYGIDLSEMYLAYFAFGDPRTGKSFGFSRPGESILNQRGKTAMALAFTSRQGAIDERELPYGSSTVSAYLVFPEDYTPVLQLRDAYSLGQVNKSLGNVATVKRMLMNYGAIAIGYHDGGVLGYHHMGDTSAFYHTSSLGITDEDNHATLVGWDDNFPREKFSDTDALRPKENGAWLVRNSWGTSWGKMSGYFWMSYEQTIQNATAFVVEPADNGLLYHGHDDLGYVTSAPGNWAANIFTTGSMDEIVREVAFYTTGDDTQYQISIYDLGEYCRTSPCWDPVPPPVPGKKLLVQQSGKAAYAGYHRVALNKRMRVGAFHRFSVVLKLTTKHPLPIAIETNEGFWSIPGVPGNPAYAPDVVVNPGESWFSSDGKSWTDGADTNVYFKPRNATIKAFTGVPPVVITKDIKSYPRGHTYNDKLEASGPAPITWTKASGTLPPGLTLSSDGWLTGTTTKDGTYNFSVKAANDYGSHTYPLRIYVGDAPVITTTTATLPGAVVGVNYNYTLQTTGMKPVTLTAEGLPAGLKLTNGRLTGKPTAKGEYTFTVTAKNVIGSTSKQLTLTVGEKPKITTTALQGAQVNERYSATLEADGTKPITWVVNGKLPAGMSLSESGNLYGTPTKTGTYSISAKATNKMGTVTKALKLIVGERPSITTNSELKGAIVGMNYNVTLAATGTKPMTWSLSAGSSPLPAWLKLSAQGRLSGAPLAAEVNKTYRFTVEAKNAIGSTTKTLSLEVGKVPVITTTSLKGAQINEYYSATLTADGVEPITWSYSGKLPDGMGLDLTHGILAGTPWKSGTYSFTVYATNKMGRSKAKSFRIVVGARPVITSSAELKLVAETADKTHIIYAARKMQATGTSPITWEWGYGWTPPSWLRLGSGGTLSISAPPESAIGRTHTPYLIAKNAIGTAQQVMTIRVGAPTVIPTVFPNLILPDAKAGTFYSTTLQAKGTGPITWAVSGSNIKTDALPDGLTLSASGVLSGTPTKPGNYKFRVSASTEFDVDMKPCVLIVK